MSFTGATSYARRIWLIRGTSMSTSPRSSTKDSRRRLRSALRSLGPALVPHGDTVGVAAADDDGYAVSLIQSVYHAFGSGLIDPATGILFHNRGTGFSLDDASPNVIAPRKRPAHTLMPVMTTYRGRPRHVLATMGGQGQPQILTQVLLRALGGAGAEAAVSDPRAVVGLQADGGTADSVTAEADLLAVARASIGRAGLASTEVAPHTESLGHANVVFADDKWVDDGGR